MKIFRVVFGVLCVIFMSKSEDPHHIEHRVLKNEDSSETTLEPQNALISNLKSMPSQNTSLNSTQGRPSDVLELQINTLSSNNSADALPQVENNTILTFGNNSSLLRNTSISAKPVVNVDNPVYTGVVPIVSANGIHAPKIFPNGTSVNGAKIIEGDSERLQTLVSQLNTTTEKNKNITNVDTEVNDLLNNTVNKEVASHHHPLEPEEPAQIQDKFNDDTELIENEDKTEDELRHREISNMVVSHHHPLEPEEPAQIQDQFNDDTKLIENGDKTENELRHREISNIDDEPPALQQRYLAAILVCSLVAASVICYAALLVWRRYLENRYGSRTMLVNEEEFDDPNDLRHFSI